MSFIITSNTKKSFDEALQSPGQMVGDQETSFLVNQEISKLRETAEAEGYKVGYEKGHLTGHSEARSEGNITVQSAIAALQEACGQLASPLSQKEKDIAALVTDLAFEIARHIVGIEVSASSTSLKKLVTQLIHEAAAERRAGQNIVIRLNPTDHGLICDSTNIENVIMLADSNINRGGALLEIIPMDDEIADTITWNATIDSRIDAIRNAIGQDLHI